MRLRISGSADARPHWFLQDSPPRHRREGSGSAAPHILLVSGATMIFVSLQRGLSSLTKLASSQTLAEYAPARSLAMLAIKTSSPFGSPLGALRGLMTAV